MSIPLASMKAEESRALTAKLSRSHLGNGSLSKSTLPRRSNQCIQLEAMRVTGMDGAMAQSCPFTATGFFAILNSESFLSNTFEPS